MILAASVLLLQAIAAILQRKKPRLHLHNRGLMSYPLDASTVPAVLAAPPHHHLVAAVFCRPGTSYTTAYRPVKSSNPTAPRLPGFRRFSPPCYNPLTTHPKAKRGTAMNIGNWISAIGLIITIGVLLGWQIADYRDRRLHRKWTALHWSFDAFSEDDIIALAQYHMHLASGGKEDNLTAKQLAQALWAVDHLNVIAIAFDEGYLDNDLFLQSRATDLALLHQDITHHDSRLRYAIQRRPLAQNLLAAATAHYQSIRQEHDNK